MTLPAGARLGPYEILAPIGAGGMGEVYRARDPRLGRDVAIKVLPASLLDRPGPAPALRAGGARRRRAQSSQHRDVYDIGTDDGAPYVVPSCSRARRCAHGSPAAASRRARRSTTPSRSRTASPPRTRRASSIAISSPRTSSSRRTARQDPRLRPGEADPSRDPAAQRHEPPARRPSRIVHRHGRLHVARAGPRSPPTLAATSSRSARCSTRCSPASARSEATRPSRRWRRSSRRTRRTSGHGPEHLGRPRPDRPPLPREGSRAALPVRPRPGVRARHDLEPLRARSRARATSGDLGAALARSRSSRRRRLSSASPRALFSRGRPRGPPSLTYRMLTFRKGTVVDAFFAPDGQTVVYSAAWEGAPPHLFSTRPGGTESRSLGAPGR